MSAYSSMTDDDGGAERPGPSPSPSLVYQSLRVHADASGAFGGTAPRSSSPASSMRSYHSPGQHSSSSSCPLPFPCCCAFCPAAGTRARSVVLWMAFVLVLTAAFAVGLFQISPPGKWSPTAAPTVTPPSTPVPAPPATVPPSNRTNLVPILVLSDVHLDLYYRAGAGSRFCQSASVPAGAPPEYFSRLGAYGCDAPLALLESALRAMSTLLPCAPPASAAAASSPLPFCTRAAAIVLVGDLSAHANWNLGPADGAMTRNDTLANVNATLAAVRRYFPSTPLVVTLGNNDVCTFGVHRSTFYDTLSRWLYLSVLVSVIFKFVSLIV
jgi:hypothetical protein